MDAQIEKLREQLMHTAEEFSEDAEALGALLEDMVNDVDRAESELLEIVPVAHHSPASGIQMLRRLRERQPKVIFMEMCEDMRELVPKLSECRLPVALQAFASESTDDFPPEWSPLTVVAPLTEFGAEYQAMSYAMTHGMQLVFVDRSVDHVFQNIPQESEALEEMLPDEAEVDDEEEGHISHGSALGIQVGSMIPTFGEFEEFLCQNARVRNFTEWWEQYVENTVIGADWETYRRVMFLVGSLLRRLGRREQDVESDRWRERYMWTRIKQYMKAHKIAPEDAIYICGAIHGVSDVEEYGLENDRVWEIPPRTKTSWLYGLIPSSFSAIERQFAHPPGTISLAEATWKKSLQALKLKPFKIKGGASKALPRPKVGGAGEARDITEFLTSPPEMETADQEQLLAWCVDIVKLARKNGYLATTADSIAIYQTSVLLAGMRNRRHPTANDFRDAAVTCLEKSRVPGKRDIPRICDILLGGDRTGSVGYESMPPLAKNVYDRLAVLPVPLTSSTVQRALMDFKQHPEYLPASDLLWKLHYLTHGGPILRPIMGERTLGHVPIQESWDIAIGKYQRDIIMLGYEGVTVEQVLDLRLKKEAFGPKSTTISALQATEDSILFLKSKRLTEELGQRAVSLLLEEIGAQSAPEIFARVRRLVHYYRAQPDGLADWIEHFVTTGYSHYATLLPDAFADRDTSPEEIAGMLGFIFTLESLALSLGCDRSQLLIAVRQAATVAMTPDKIGLLWSAQFLLGDRSAEEIRAFFDEALENELLVPALPDYITGFVLALRFTPLVGRMVVELLSKAFGRLPDRILLPWLPNLMTSLKPLGADLVPVLIKEAGISFPGHVAELKDWTPPWDRPAPKLDFGDDEDAEGAEAVQLGEEEAAARGLLFGHRESTDALAAAVGGGDEWIEALSSETPSGAGAGPSLSGELLAAHRLLEAHKASTDALAALLGAGGGWSESAVAPESKPPGKSSRRKKKGGVVTKLLDEHGESLEALAALINS